MNIKQIIFALIIIFPVIFYAQEETIPLEHQVYSFLKEMKVKKIIGSIHDDSPNLSRGEVLEYLNKINKQFEKLSNTEKKYLKKYLSELDYESFNQQTTTELFGGAGFWNNISDILSKDKLKYFYYYQNEDANIFVDGIGHFKYAHRLKPSTVNSETYDMGFRFKGTVFNHLGYYFTAQKGLLSGDVDFGTIIEPKLNYNFKFVEKLEKENGYDFTDGYLRYATEIRKGMKIAIQLGREQTTLGFGYGSKFTLSDSHANLDFFKFTFKYGIVNYTSITGSTVGRYDRIRDNNYTKFIAANRLSLSFPNLFDFGIEESVIYSGRGVDLAYLNPLLFYKFAEMSLQDRDNATLSMDIQTDIFKNFELQAKFFLDENILSNMSDLSHFMNKTGYQVGFYWYQPLRCEDLSIVFEYTKIRPFVYSHANPQLTYTSWDELLGHRIGGNADELMLKANFNLNDRIKVGGEYRKVRKGNNVYDENGKLVLNSGGDSFQPHRPFDDPDHATFLDGIRIDSHIISLGIYYEAFRNLFFDIIYNYKIDENIANGTKTDLNYITFKFTIEY